MKELEPFEDLIKADQRKETTILRGEILVITLIVGFLIWYVRNVYQG